MAMLDGTRSFSTKKPLLPLFTTYTWRVSILASTPTNERTSGLLTFSFFLSFVFNGEMKVKPRVLMPSQCRKHTTLKTVVGTFRTERTQILARSSFLSFAPLHIRARKEGTRLEFQLPSSHQGRMTTLKSLLCLLATRSVTTNRDPP